MAGGGRVGGGACGWAGGSVIYSGPPDYERISPTLDSPTATGTSAAADIERTTATDRPTDRPAANRKSARRTKWAQLHSDIIIRTLS